MKSQQCSGNVLTERVQVRCITTSTECAVVNEWTSGVDVWMIMNMQILKYLLTHGATVHSAFLYVKRMYSTHLSFLWHVVIRHYIHVCVCVCVCADNGVAVSMNAFLYVKRMYATHLSFLWHVVIRHYKHVCVCVCADNGVAVSMNDIIIKLVAATLKVSRYFYSTIHLACEHIGTIGSQ